MTFTDEQINTYANLQLSLRNEQTNGLERDWSDTAILMARQLRDAQARWEPTAAIKAQMIGAFEVKGNERERGRHVPWTTIKAIVAAWRTASEPSR